MREARWNQTGDGINGIEILLRSQMEGSLLEWSAKSDNHSLKRNTFRNVKATLSSPKIFGGTLKYVKMVK
jgi:hypothetical protein